MIGKFGTTARAGALALLLAAAGTLSAAASAGMPAPLAWAQGSLTPPGGQKRVTAPGGLRGRAAHRGHRGWHHRAVRKKYRH